MDYIGHIDHTVVVHTVVHTESTVYSLPQILMLNKERAHLIQPDFILKRKKNKIELNFLTEMNTFSNLEGNISHTKIAEEEFLNILNILKE